ncbi:hypothetical protein EVAR_33089_1 [Eumeta japonica]|uniref:Uncharacterized protein n=1 Tax=Eumeta variegata TaxID=151549 RepID=A0A4C1Y902_EUMVA|nr:hypothetical protein EVAR_33089_1 [Eumeta japonica]
MSRIAMHPYWRSEAGGGEGAGSSYKEDGFGEPTRSLSPRRTWRLIHVTGGAGGAGVHSIALLICKRALTLLSDAFYVRLPLAEAVNYTPEDERATKSYRRALRRPSRVRLV